MESELIIKIIIAIITLIGTAYASFSYAKRKFNITTSQALENNKNEVHNDTVLNMNIGRIDSNDDKQLASINDRLKGNHETFEGKYDYKDITITERIQININNNKFIGLAEARKGDHEITYLLNGFQTNNDFISGTYVNLDDENDHGAFVLKSHNKRLSKEYSGQLLFYDTSTELDMIDYSWIKKKANNHDLLNQLRNLF